MYICTYTYIYVHIHIYTHLRYADRDGGMAAAKLLSPDSTREQARGLAKTASGDVYMYICKRKVWHVCRYVGMHICVSMYVCMYGNKQKVCRKQLHVKYACTYASVYVCMYVCMYVLSKPCICECMYVCKYLCMY
jgi:hypothetical protein